MILCPFAYMKLLKLFTSDHIDLDWENFFLKYLATTKYSLIDKVLIKYFQFYYINILNQPCYEL